MKLKQFRPRLKTSIHRERFFWVLSCFRVPPDFVNPFSEMIQHFIHAEFPHSPPGNREFLVFLLLLLFFSLVPVCSPTSRSIRGSPTIRPPLLKTRAGEWGDSRWSFSMDLHYLQTGFSRCEIKIGASHQWSHLRLDRSASKKPWKGGLPFERRTTRARLFDVYTRHIRVLVIRKYVDSTLQGRGDRGLIPLDLHLIRRISSLKVIRRIFDPFCQNSINVLK